MVLVKFNQNIPVSASEGLTHYSLASGKMADILWKAFSVYFMKKILNNGPQIYDENGHVFEFCALLYGKQCQPLIEYFTINQQSVATVEISLLMK